MKKKPVGGEAAAAQRIAARERLLAAKAAMQAKAPRKAESKKVVFEGVLFKVESLARKATPAKTKELGEAQKKMTIMASQKQSMQSGERPGSQSVAWRSSLEFNNQGIFGCGKVINVDCSSEHAVLICKTKLSNTLQGNYARHG